MSSVTLRSQHVPLTRRQQEETLVGARTQAVDSYQHTLSYAHNNNLLKSTLSTEDHNSKFLQVSPYTELEHNLDLSTVDTRNRLLALALTNLEPTSSDYATREYSRTFNWPIIFATLRSLAAAEGFHLAQTEFYIVEFRSKLKQDIDNNLLFQLDKQSHREATAAGGLLKYWYGSPDSERRNLATCVWRSKEDAIEGGKGPWHKQAREIISSTYESINVKGLRLVVDEGAEGWKFEPWSFH